MSFPELYPSKANNAFPDVINVYVLETHPHPLRMHDVCDTEFLPRPFDCEVSRTPSLYVEWRAAGFGCCATGRLGWDFGSVTGFVPTSTVGFRLTGINFWRLQAEVSCCCALFFVAASPGGPGCLTPGFLGFGATLSYARDILAGI